MPLRLGNQPGLHSRRRNAALEALAEFAVGDWSVAEASGRIAVTLAAVPANATDVQYRIDGGSSVNSGGTVDFQTAILVNGSRDIEIRATAPGYRPSPWSGIKSVTIAGGMFAPSATLNTDETDRVVTAWLTSITGNPTPTPALDVFTVGGVDVSGSVTGAGTVGDPWTYDAVASSAAGASVVIEASLDNGVAPAWSDSDTLNVAADLFAPVASGALSDLTLTVGEAMTPRDVSADFDLGTPEATVALQSGTLPAGLSFDGTTLSGTPTAEAGAVTLTFRATNSVGDDDTAFQVTVQAASEVSITEIFVMGASLVDGAFGNAYDPDTQTWGSANAAATAALQTEAGLDSPIPVYGWGRPGARLGYREDFDIPSAPDRIDIIRADFPNALILCHIGGGDATALRTQATMGPGEKNNWNTELGALIDKAAADGNVYISTLTFRDFAPTNSCFYDPDLGARPFNELDDVDFTGIVPAIAAEPALAHTLTSYGRPFADYYRWMLTNFEVWLDRDDPTGDGDGIHPTDTGDQAMQDYTIEVLAHILNGTEPAEITERVATLNISDPGDGTLEITFDGGIDTTLDSITLSDADADPYWEGTHTTYADGSALDLSLTDTLAAKCLVGPTPYVKTDADSSGTASVGDTVALDDIGIWLQSDSSPTFAVAWYDDQGVIPGATGMEYVLAEGQRAEDVYPVITASASGKTDESHVCPSLTVDAGGWAFSGATVTTIPTSEGWAFTGAVVDTIPAGI